MKKMIIALVALFTVTTVTMAESKTYASMGMAVELIDESDTEISVDLQAGVAIELKGGIFFDNNFGIEGSVSKSIKNAEGSEVFFNKNFSAEADVRTIYLFGTYNYRLNSSFFIIPKIGFTHTNIDLNLKMDGDRLENTEDSNSDFSYGVEAQYSLNSSTNIYMGYTLYNLEFDGSSFDGSHLSVGIQQYFK